MKITQADFGNFSPSAVGVPQQDSSGKIIASGAEALGKALGQREDRVNTVAAMAKFGDFELAYATKKAELQKQYRDNPKDFPLAMREASEVLAGDFAKGLNPGIAEKFTSIATSHLAQDADNLVNWSVSREQEKVIGDIQQTYQNLSLAAERGSTPENLKDILSGVDEASVMSRQFIAEGTANTWREQYRADAIKNGMETRIYNNAAKTYSDLASGKYDGIIEAADIKKYLSIAKSAMVNNAVLEQYRALTTSAVELSELQDGITAGTVSIGDINRRLEWAELNKDKKDVNGQVIVSEHYVRGLQALRDISLNQDSRTTEQKNIDERSFGQDFLRRWDMFLAGRQRGKASGKDYDDVIGLYSDLINARRSGTIDEEEFNEKKRILDTRLTTSLNPKSRSASLSEALQNAGRYHWWDNPRDVYSEGYKIIRDYLDKQRKDLSQEERLRYRDKYVLSFTEMVKSFPPEKIAEVKNKSKFALDILQGVNGEPGLLAKMDVYKHPENGQPIMYGQTILYGGQRYQFLGLDDKGNLRLRTSKDFLKQVK